MYQHPHKAPWDGEEGKEQHKLGIENACLLARNFIKNKIDVVILDVVTNETNEVYRKLLPEAKIVLLLPSFEEAHNRFIQRQDTITEDEFRLVYQWQESLIAYDEKIDNTRLTAEECASKVLGYA